MDAFGATAATSNEEKNLRPKLKNFFGPLKQMKIFILGDNEYKKTKLMVTINPNFRYYIPEPNI